MSNLINKIQVMAIKASNLLFREGVVMGACENHLNEIMSMTRLDIESSQIKDLINRVEALHLESRGPMMAYVVVLLNKGQDIGKAVKSAYNWALTLR